MAYSVTVLAWGILSFENGYKEAGEWERSIEQVKMFLTNTYIATQEYALTCTRLTHIYGAL